MGAFRFVALDADGRTERGALDGGSARQVRENLRARGLTPLEVEPLVDRPSDAGSGTRVRPSDFTLFARLLAELLDAGLELEAALRTTAAQAPPRLERFHATVLARVLQGVSLADSLADVAGVSTMSVAAVAAGERSGALGPVLRALAEHGERREAMRGRIALAMLYPAILMLVSTAVALTLVTWVVPEVARVFDGYQRELPWLTRALMAAGEFFRANGAWLVPTVLVAVGLSIWQARRPSGQQMADRVLSRVPGVAALRRTADRERFLDTLAMLLSGGVPVVQALRAGAAVVETGTLRVAAEAAADDVERGRSVRDALESTDLLSVVGAQLVAAGEESSRLDTMLARAARIESDRLARQLALWLGILEPALVLIMGGVVLLVVLAILLPIFELNSLIA